MALEMRSLFLMNVPAPALETIDLTYSYPAQRGRSGVTALETVNLRVGQGEIASILGPSGCGKSTLLAILAGLLQPASGEVLVDGRKPEDRLGLFSYMPQKDLLLPWLTALDNAALLLEIRGAPAGEARNRAREMLARFDLEQYAQTRPSELSGGMRQRIALIRTFLQPQSVLLDEPFASLDSMTRTDLQEWLLHLQTSTGRSMVLVTHDIDEAIFLSDRVYVMSAGPGKIVAEVPVTLPKSRTLEITGTAEFAALKGELLSRLRASRARRVAAA